MLNFTRGNVLSRGPARALLPAMMTAALSASAAADGIVEEFDVGDGGVLVIDAESAKLTIRGGSDSLRFHIARGSDDADEIEDDFTIDFSQDGNEVRLDVERRRKLDGWWNRSLVVTVDVPERFDVDVASSGGSIDVDRIIGDIRAKTSGGGIRFEDVDGPIFARTSGGSIRLDGTSGDADLKTSGGSIKVGHVDGEVQAKTSGGGITIDHAGGPVTATTSGGGINVNEVYGAIEAKTSGGAIRASIMEQPRAGSSLQTSGGSVTVTMDPSIAVNVDAKTSGGKVSSDLPVAMRGHISSRRMEGEINGGGPTLYVRASGGSVNLRSL